MADFFADENVPIAVVAHLRALGHDVLTALEAGRANQGIPDEDVLLHATGLGRAVLTGNRRHFHRLHLLCPNHAGIVTFTDDSNETALAQRIHTQVIATVPLTAVLIRVVRGTP